MEQALYQKDLLNQALLDMLSLSFSQFRKTLEALANNDADLAEEVVYKEARLNALDLKIDKDTERFIALFNPVASDLRHVLTILKMNYELERIADHAYRISKYLADDEAKPIPQKLLDATEFEKISDTILHMMELARDSYEEQNVKLARKIFKKDKILDKLNLKSFDTLAKEIKNDIEVTDKALILLSIIKKCERVGDLLKNIAEEIIFYIEAENLKHQKKKK